MIRPKLPHQFRHASQFALRMIRIESLAQSVGGLFRFELQQHPVKQRELLAIHALDLFVQDGLELFRLDRRCGVAVFHAGTLHRRNEADKVAQKRGAKWFEPLIYVACLPGTLNSQLSNINSEHV